MNKLKQLIQQFERSTEVLTRMGLLGQMIKELQTITKQELRQQWMQMGEEDATKFLSNISL